MDLRPVQRLTSALPPQKNTIENSFIQLEVLSYWLKYLNNPSQNEIKSLITELLVLGSLKPRNINRAFGLCYKISCNSSEEDRMQFINSVEEASEEYILANHKSLYIPHLCDDRLMSYLFLYSEVASIMNHPINEDIPQFLFAFLQAIFDSKILTGALKIIAATDIRIF